MRMLQEKIPQLDVLPADTSGLAVFRDSLMRIPPVLLSISGFCTAGASSTGSISSVGTARTAITRTLNTCPVYSE